MPSAGEEALRAAEAAFAAGNIDEAAELLAKVPRDIAIADRIAALEQGIAFAKAGADGPSEAELREQLGIDPLDHDARIKLASVLAGKRRFREAMEELLEVVRLGRHSQADEARTQLLVAVHAGGGGAGARRRVPAQARERPALAMQRTLITIGIAVLVAGLLWPWLSKLGLGRLPGDFRIQTGNSVFYFPLATCLLVSVVLSLVLWLLRR